MKFGALTISLIVAAGIVGGVTMAQDGSPGAEGDGAPAPAESEPAADASSGEEAIDVEALIAEFNGGRETPVTFDQQARDWIALGAQPDEIGRILSGELNVPTADAYSLAFIDQDGKVRTIKSNPDTMTPPYARNVPAFASEIDAANRPNVWLPVAASKTAKEVDAMFNFIMWINYIFTGIIGFLMVFFCIKYRRRPGVRADQTITHNTPLEIFWSVVPTILCAIMFWGGYTTFLDMRTPPSDAMQITVGARQWGWDFTYPNRVQTVGEFHVPENTPIEMVMSSSDVIHSFHLPAFRQKSDVLPNRFTSVWFDSGAPGIYRVYCSEYCGKLHGNMYAKLVVEPREDYEAWLKKEGDWMVTKTGELKSYPEIGELVYTRLGCNACHSLDGKHGTGPTFAGLWGLERRFDAAGTETAIADLNYVRESILDPYEKLVYPYGKNMTLYSPKLTDDMILGVVELLKSVKDVKRDPDAWE